MNDNRKKSTYLIKELFGPTIQGEGFHTGRSCVFLRFAVCNLACTWCDTDFSEQGARRMSAEEICEELIKLDTGKSKLLIVTGGEPTLQWDEPLREVIHAAGFSVNMESNGTKKLKAPVSWLTISPKVQFHGKETLLPSTELTPSELKVVVDSTVDEARLMEYASFYDVEHMFLQPCMDDNYDENLARSIAFIAEHPRWRLSIQVHKVVQVP